MKNYGRIQGKKPEDIMPYFRTSSILIIIITGSITSAASSISLEELNASEHSLNKVSTSGTVVETFRDEIDPGWEFLVLKDGGTFLPVAFPARTEIDPAVWLDAEISVTGSYFDKNGGARNFAGPYLSVQEPVTNNIRVLTPRTDDPYDCEPLDQTQWIAPKDVVRLGRRSVSGVVLARWDGNYLALRTDQDDTVIVRLRGGHVPPPPGRRICAVGYPETDLYRLHLTRAIWREQANAATPPLETPLRVSLREFFLDESGRSRMLYGSFNGKPITLSGTVRRITPGDAGLRIDLDCRYGRIPVEIDPLASADWSNPSLDTEIEVTGICLMECETWNPNLVLPRIKACRLFVRNAADIKILNRPPWWTPAKLAIVIGVLLVGIIGFAAWSVVLRKIVQRRNRELLKEQIARVSADLRTDERTRLAVELHDALSQTLEGVAFQIAATKDLMAVSPEVAGKTLDAASRMLLSSRMELKRCLFDLRHDALEAKSFDEALRTTLDPISGEAALTVRFNVRREIFTDTSAHIVLCIIRELVSNAVRHGKARHVRVAGEHHDGILSFSVRDDGAGFDAARCPGPAEGHFGLEGIRERVRRLNGVFSLGSFPGGPTRAVVTANTGLHPGLKEVSA